MKKILKETLHEFALFSGYTAFATYIISIFTFYTGFIQFASVFFQASIILTFIFLPLITLDILVRLNR